MKIIAIVTLSLLCFECLLASDDKMLEIMLRSLSVGVGDKTRMDPLLRQLMVTALQRSQDESDRDNLTPPRYRQDPLLRQLRDHVVDNFADMVLQLPPRAQDHLLRVLREEGMEDRDIVNLMSPSARQDPLLRQLMANVMEDFLSSLTPPPQRQNPLLRQLASNAVDDSTQNLSPPVYRQNPLLRQLNTKPDVGDSLTAPLFRQDLDNSVEVKASQQKMSFDTLMKAIDIANQMMNTRVQVPSNSLSAVSPPVSRPTNIDLATIKTGGRMTETGQLCVTKEDIVTTLETDPVLQCTHGQQEKCHVSYVTHYQPSTEQVCKENFEKSCQISFTPETTKQTVRKCGKPLIKTCDGRGDRICRTEYETACETRQVKLNTGKYVGETKCEKLPVDICGAGCVTREGDQVCRDEVVDTVVDVPQEYCDIIPHKTCSQATRLVPQLKPTTECTMVPSEVCTMNYSNKKMVDKPLRTEWCLDKNEMNSLMQSQEL